MARTEKSMDGKVVAITGGARGIGRATAARLIAAGARVALGDIDAAAAEDTARELGRGTVGLPLDVTDRDGFARFLDSVERELGPLDVLINNAGIMPLGAFADEPDVIARRQIEINLHGVIHGSKLAIERFRAHGGGHLVNVASTAGKFGAPGGATYSATKHAVVGLSEAIRREVAQDGIDVSIVMPLVVNTDLGSGLHDVRGLKVLQPEDVADAIADALRTGRVDVYVPSWIGVILRLQSVVPRAVTDLLVRAFGADEVLTTADSSGRAAYNERLAGDAAQAGPGSDAGSAADGAVPASPDPEPSQAAIR